MFSKIFSVGIQNIQLRDTQEIDLSQKFVGFLINSYLDTINQFLMDLFMIFSRTFGMPGSSKKTAVARVTRQQRVRVGGHEDIDVVEMGC